MYQIYQVAWFEILISLINIHIILTRLLPGKLRKKTALILFVLAVLPCILIAYLYSDVLIGQMAISACTLLSFIMPLFTVRGVRKGQILYVSSFYIGLILALFSLIAWVINLKADESILILIDIAANFFMLIMCILVATGRIFKQVSKNITLIPRRLKIGLLISMWVSGLAAFYSPFVFSQYPYTKDMIFLQILIAVLILLMGVMFPLLIANSMSSAYYKSILAGIEKQMEVQAKHYELIAKANDDLRKFKHDFKNLRIGLMSFLKNRDTYGALQYLKERDKILDSDYIIFETGNPVVDALLSEKYAIALGINTQIKFDGVIPNNGISPTDTCIILGNSIDNALEACAKMPTDIKKTISITAYSNNGFLFIRIENPTLYDVQIINNSILSTKTDKEAHGIGLHSIDSTIKNYSGDMKLSCENNIFTIEIDLDLNLQLVAV